MGRKKFDYDKFWFLGLVLMELLNFLHCTYIYVSRYLGRSAKLSVIQICDGSFLKTPEKMMDWL